jgi:hypothetical protein
MANVDSSKWLVFKRPEVAGFGRPLTVSEPFLLRAGLVVKDDAGRRQLTADGRLHLLHYGNDPD